MRTMFSFLLLLALNGLVPADAHRTGVNIFCFYDVISLRVFMLTMMCIVPI